MAAVAVQQTFLLKSLICNVIIECKMFVHSLDFH